MVLYVQEVVIPILYRKLLYKMGSYFLDIKYLKKNCSMYKTSGYLWLIYICHFVSKQSCLILYYTFLLGDPEVTANLHGHFAYLYLEGCVISIIYSLRERNSITRGGFRPGGNKNFRNKILLKFRNKKYENRNKICVRGTKPLRLETKPLRI